MASVAALTLLDARYWLESAVKAHGAEVHRVSIDNDAGRADIEIVLEGNRIQLSITQEQSIE